MLSGRHPGRVGVVGNVYIELETGERRYCVWDPAPDAAVIGGGEELEGRSPRALRADALGDWMKRAWPRSRVFTVSGKDRSAVTLGGERPDAAYWFRRNGRPGFTTSRYYASELPDWVETWNQGLALRVPVEWVHATEPLPEQPTRGDDYPGESDSNRRTSPHPLRAEDPEEFVENLYGSPFIDDVTVAFARTLVEVENLGGGSETDLLAIALSGTDTVGHAYGPGGLESRDALQRLDRTLGDLLVYLEERTDGSLVVALTSDHGVLPLPEWLAETGELTCPVPGGRQGLISFLVAFYWELYWELSPWSWPGLWMNVSSQLTVDRQRAAEYGVSVERVVEVAENWLEAQPVIREAWTRHEIATGQDAFARLYRNSYDVKDGERSGDIALQVEPTCLLDYAGAGTTHGSPYLYDRAVPIVFWGEGVEPGRTSGPAATVDIAPTLAGRLGLTPPGDLDGRDLLTGSPVSKAPVRQSVPIAASPAR